MRCPYCGSAQNKVVDSREAGDAIRRRRQCESCGERFTTYERVDALRMYVVKRDGRRERFDREKLVRGLERAAAAGKRPIEPERLDQVADAIADMVRRRGGEAPADWVGELALGGLARLDRVAAVMFASVAGPDQLAMEDLQDGPVPSAQKSILATPQSGPKTTRRAARNTERRGHASHP